MQVIIVFISYLLTRLFQKSPDGFFMRWVSVKNRRELILKKLLILIIDRDDSVSLYNNSHWVFN